MFGFNLQSVTSITLFAMASAAYADGNVNSLVVTDPTGTTVTTVSQTGYHNLTQGNVASKGSNFSIRQTGSGISTSINGKMDSSRVTINSTSKADYPFSYNNSSYVQIAGANNSGDGYAHKNEVIQNLNGQRIDVREILIGSNASSTVNVTGDGNNVGHDIKNDLDSRNFDFSNSKLSVSIVGKANKVQNGAFSINETADEGIYGNNNTFLNTLSGKSNGVSLYQEGDNSTLEILGLSRFLNTGTDFRSIAVADHSGINLYSKGNGNTIVSALNSQAVVAAKDPTLFGASINQYNAIAGIATGSDNTLISEISLTNTDSVYQNAKGDFNNLKSTLNAVAYSSVSEQVNGYGNVVKSSQVNVSKSKMKLISKSGDGNTLTSSQSNGMSDNVKVEVTGGYNTVAANQFYNDNSNLKMAITGYYNTISSSEGSVDDPNFGINRRANTTDLTINGNYNEFSSVQLGNKDVIRANITGRNDLMDITQEGNRNVLDISIVDVSPHYRDDINNQITSMQVGNNNIMSLSIQGLENAMDAPGSSIKAAQIGNNNNMGIKFTGNNIHGEFTQTGNNLSYSLNANISGQTFKVDQHN